MSGVGLFFFSVVVVVVVAVVAAAADSSVAFKRKDVPAASWIADEVLEGVG